MPPGKKRYRDPHAAREAARYENPVPSRELIIQVLNDEGRPLTSQELEKRLDVRSEEDREAFDRRLRAMLRDGQLVLNRRAQFGIAERMDLVRGRVQGHRDGFGFLIPDDSGQEDLYLSPRQMQGVLDGDRALASVEGVNRFGKREGRVVEVLERGPRELVGRYRREAGLHFLEPENRRIARQVLISELNGLKPTTGDFVRVKILRYPDHDPALLCGLEEIITGADEPGMEVDVALRNYEIPWEWPQEVEQEAAGFPATVPADAGKGRLDVRKLPLVTIDGEDARDFDDAVYVARRPRGGWRLMVAIADVSHYVRPSSALDREAGKRGNSVYFPNRVIPMLPEALSNGLCSLNPQVDRLCMLCDMQISAKGRVTRFTFHEGVMRSRARLTYTKVGALIEQPDSELAQSVRAEVDDEVHDALWAFYELYGALNRHRQERGAIDFDTVETRIIYDDNRKIEAIVPVVRNVAHRMIEEAMLAANISAARLLEQSGLPTLFRNHEPPAMERLETLQTFLGGLGLSLAWSEANGKPEPKVFQKLTEQIKERPDRFMIQMMILRSLTQAVYGPENGSHFGLAYDAYAHFTSPIRRYPDLLVHRAIRYLIRNPEWKEHVDNSGKLPELPRTRILPYSLEDMVVLGEHCSMTERRADDATRDVVQWLKCQYMEDHVGEVMGGVISGVTSFGLFVTLDDLYIEGLVHVTNLKSDYYHFDEVRHALVGENSHVQYRVGDTVQVQVAAVHTADRRIDLMMAGAPGHQGVAGKASVRAALKAGKIPGKGKSSSGGKRATSRKPGGSGKPGAGGKSKSGGRGNKTLAVGSRKKGRKR